MVEALRQKRKGKVKKNSLIIDKIKELMEKLKKGLKSKKLDNSKCKINDLIISQGVKIIILNKKNKNLQRKHGKEKYLKETRLIKKK